MRQISQTSAQKPPKVLCGNPEEMKTYMVSSKSHRKRKMKKWQLKPYSLTFDQ